MTTNDQEKSADKVEENDISESDIDSDDGEDDPPVESLVAGRAKRATAGNRLSSLLDQEADDELELLFAEDEEDVEFDVADDEDDADEQLESSDEDDADQGPPVEGAVEEDLEGEKELQRQARVERQAKKRKAQDAFFKPPAFRKRVKIDPTTPSEGPVTPVPKPRRKSDRISSVEGPTRASSRKATVQNKEDVHARIKEHEKRRLQQIAVMEAAAKRKEKAKSKVLTQADRMAEAEKTERLNSKSLNRWEATEKKRSEEQMARLAALQNRKLEGPVITWWSGLAEWVNGKLERVGRKGKDENGMGRKEGHETGKENSVTKMESVTTTAEEVHEDGSKLGDSKVESTERQQQDSISQPNTNPADGPNSTTSTTNLPTTTTATTGGFLDGIHYYASLPSQQPSAQQEQEPQQSPLSTTLPIHPAVAPTPPQAVHPPSETTQYPIPPLTPSNAAEQPPPPLPPNSIPTPDPSPSYTTHNLVILTNFDQPNNNNSSTIAPKDSKRAAPADALDSIKKELSFLLNPTSSTTTSNNKRQRNNQHNHNNHKSSKPPPPEPCVITLQPARYRDPSTGLAYLDSNAYKEIQRLKAGGCQWSTLLGCYVGPVDGVARGVPERFWNGGGGGTGAAGAVGAGR